MTPADMAAAQAGVASAFAERGILAGILNRAASEARLAGATVLDTAELDLCYCTDGRHDWSKRHHHIASEADIADWQALASKPSHAVTRRTQTTTTPWETK